MSFTVLLAGVVCAAHALLFAWLSQDKLEEVPIVSQTPVMIEWVKTAEPVRKMPPLPQREPEPPPREKSRAVTVPAPLRVPQPVAVKESAQTPVAATEASQTTEPPTRALSPQTSAVSPIEPVAPTAQAASPAPKEVSLASVRYKVEPQPEYPAGSRRAGEEGRVIVRALIDLNGKPQQASVSTSSFFPRLDAAAVASVMRASFFPLLEGGRPVPVWVHIPIVFKYEE